MMRATLLGMSLLVPLLLTAGEASAQTADRAASCSLGGGVAALIRLQLNNALAGLNGGTAGSNLKVDAIVVYSVTNPNSGQPLDGGGFTGPILCTFTDGLLPAQTKYSTQATSASAPIPDVDVLASEIQTSLQYRRNSNSVIEQLMCLSTKSNNDCFRIFPTSGGPT
jgi:hypothetical protein